MTYKVTFEFECDADNTQAEEKIENAILRAGVAASAEIHGLRIERTED